MIGTASIRGSCRLRKVERMVPTPAKAGAISWPFRWNWIHPRSSCVRATRPPNAWPWIGRPARRACSIPPTEGNVLSYFVGLDAYEKVPFSVVAGDRHLLGGVCGYLRQRGAIAGRVGDRAARRRHVASLGFVRARPSGDSRPQRRQRDDDARRGVARGDVGGLPATDERRSADEEREAAPAITS